MKELVGGGARRRCDTLFVLTMAVTVVVGCAQVDTDGAETGNTCLDGQNVSRVDSQEILAGMGNATSCTTPADCANGFCVDGVCCDSACTGQCQACTAAKKGSGADGVCGFITIGTDPDNECAFGHCNGSLGCTKGAILLGNGSVCTTAALCSSGSCVDGVCCNSACTSTCQACTAAKKGSGSDGTCGNIAATTDPDNECVSGDCNGLSVCGTSGSLAPNGAACALAGACASGSCADGVCCNSTCTGTCRACTASKKGGGADGICGTIAPATDPDNECPIGNCNSAGLCGGIVILGNGAACTSAAQCSSGFCADGVCCDNSCSGTCLACTAAKKGSGANGTCGAIATATDPDNECASGSCNGSGACITNGGQCTGEVGLPNPPYLNAVVKAAGDLNGDGLDDIVDRSRVYLARGWGFFEPLNSIQYPLPGGRAKLVDVDNDGDLDQVTAGEGYLHILKNAGNGTFYESNTITLSAADYEPDTADFNGDGFVDIVVNRSANSAVSVFLNQGGGIYGPWVDYTGFSGSRLKAADMDGDGDHDLVVMSLSKFRILKNQGNGTFVVGSTTTTDMYGHYSDLGTGDADGDGDTDVLMTDIEYCDVRVKSNPGNGVFPPVMGDLRLCTTFQYNHALLVDDFNGDNKSDYVSPLGNKSNVRVMINGSGTWQDYFVGESAGGSVSGDFDGDGDKDVAAAGGFGTRILINKGGGDFSQNGDVGGTLNTGASTVFAAADVDTDGTMDIVNTTSGGISVRTGLGNGTFHAAINYATVSGPSHVVAGDVNGDGKPDLAVPHRNGATVSILLNQGNGTYAPKVDYTASLPLRVALEDINGDNKRDLIVGGVDTVSVRMNQGTGTFGPPTNYTIGVNGALSVLDVTSDGFLDIVVPVGTGVMALGTLINQGNGSFVRAADVTLDNTPDRLAQADFDGDGRVDLVVGYTNRKLDVLLNNGNGTFATQPVSAGSWYRDVATGDMNRDGIPDIISDRDSYAGYGALNVLINAGNGTSFERNIYPGISTVEWIVPADFNGDGNPDLAYAKGGGSIALRFNTCWQ